MGQVTYPKPIIDAKDAAVADAAASALAAHAALPNPHGTTAADVGAYTTGEVDGLLGDKADTSVTDALGAALDAQAAQLAAKAPLASPALTDNPTAPTAAPGTNTTQIATCAFVATAITNLALGTAATHAATDFDAAGAAAAAQAASLAKANNLSDLANAATARTNLGLSYANSTDKAAFRTNLGLGSGNSVTFTNVTVSSTLTVNDAATFNGAVDMESDLSVSGTTTLAGPVNASAPVTLTADRPVVIDGTSVINGSGVLMEFKPKTSPATYGSWLLTMGEFSNGGIPGDSRPDATFGFSKNLNVGAAQVVPGQPGFGVYLEDYWGNPQEEFWFHQVLADASGYRPFGMLLPLSAAQASTLILAYSTVSFRKRRTYGLDTEVGTLDTETGTLTLPKIVATGKITSSNLKECRQFGWQNGYTTTAGRMSMSICIPFDCSITASRVAATNSAQTTGTISVWRSHDNGATWTNLTSTGTKPQLTAAQNSTVTSLNWNQVTVSAGDLIAISPDSSVTFTDDVSVILEFLRT